MLPSSVYQEGIAHRRVLRLVSGKEGEEVRVTFLLFNSLKLLQLKIFTMPRYQIWGYCVLNPIIFQAFGNQVLADKDGL